MRLADGDIVEAGGRSLRVALRPGHSPTDTLFVDDATGTALAGDHLIAHISSNPLVHRPPVGPADPATQAPRRWPPISTRSPAPRPRISAVLHTGHGASVTDYRPLIAERIRLHHRRADQVHAALADGPRSASELSTVLWPDVPVNQTFLTLCEVLGALRPPRAGGPGGLALRGETLVYERA